MHPMLLVKRNKWRKQFCLASYNWWNNLCYLCKKFPPSAYKFHANSRITWSGLMLPMSSCFRREQINLIKGKLWQSISVTELIGLARGTKGPLKKWGRNKSHHLLLHHNMQLTDGTIIAFLVIYGLEGVLVTIGNAFAIFVFWTQNLHHKRTCLILINLAVADLLVGTTELVLIPTRKITKMQADLRKLPLTQSLGGKNPLEVIQLFAICSSLYFLALISLERAFSVLWPMRHRTSSQAAYIASITITWFLGLLSSGLYFIAAFTTEIDSQCFVTTTHTLLFISLLVMFVSYLKIRMRLRLSSNQFAPTQTNRTSPDRSLRLLKTMFLVIAVSLVFWFPTFVVYTARAFCLECFPVLVFWLANALNLANSLVNPFVYIFNLPVFKEARKGF